MKDPMPNDPMTTLTAIIEQFAQRLGIKLQVLKDEKQEKAVHPEAYLKAIFPPSYYYYPLRKSTHGDLPEQLMAHAWEEITHSRHAGFVFTDGHPDDRQRKILGINLCGLKVDDRFETAFADIPVDRMDLKGLSLAETQITSFSLTEQMNGLVHLELSRNEHLKEISFEPKVELPFLKTFDAYECQLKGISFPKGFDLLFRLDLARNQKLSHVSFPNVGYPKLFTLDLSNNSLTSLHLPKGFDDLGYIYAHDNQLESLTFSDAKDFPSLVNIHVRNNQLRRIPSDFLDFPKLNNFFAHGNSFTDLPEEVIDSNEYASSFHAVRNYLDDLHRQGEERLLEAKMILIGNGLAGKTSILLKLLDKDAELPALEDRTEGLDIKVYPVKLEKELDGKKQEIEFVLNGWDFGGQGKYREVQQLFCSRKSLYVFVEAVDDQKNEDYIGHSYWLNMAKAYGYDPKEKEESPVLHVTNKIDKKDGKVFVNRGQRKGAHPGIKDFFEISCLEIDKFWSKFQEFQEGIRQSIPAINPRIFQEKYPRTWLEAKKELESRRKENYITFDEYLTLCEKHQIEKEKAETLVDILDRIGTVIYFRPNRTIDPDGKSESKEGVNPKTESKDWVILNPMWVKEAIYKVIDSDLVENGILKPAYFKYIWKKEKDDAGNSYQEREYGKFIELMRDYDLCFEDKKKNEYIVPASLSENPPEVMPSIITKEESTHIFKLEYDPFIPAGMVNKLIVKVLRRELSGFGGETEQLTGDFHEKGRMPKHGSPYAGITILDKTMWKHNVILQDTALTFNAFAWVTEVWEDKAVYIKLYGHKKGMKPLLASITKVLDGILQELIHRKYLKNVHTSLKVKHEGEFESFELLQRPRVNVWEEEETEEISPFDKVRKMVSNGKLEGAMEKLKTIAPKDYQDMIVGALGGLRLFKKKQLKGNLDSRDEDTQEKKIISSFLDLCTMIEEELETEASDND